MVFCEIVVECVLLCRCVGFGVGIGIQVQWILPRGGSDVVRCVAGMFFLKVCLQDVDDFGWVGGYDIGGWVSDGFELGLAFGVGL